MMEEELDLVARHEQDLLTNSEIGRPFLEGRPASNQETEIAEQLLADEFGKLSLTEQEQIAFDVHGFDLQHKGEDPTVIEKKLIEMEKSIQKIRNKQALEQAKSFNKAYVNDRSFRLLFLRCDNFDTKVAAQRFVKHFKVKRECFGDGEVLGRDIRLSDLSSGAIAALETGFYLKLPSHDMAGRPVMFMTSPPAHVSVMDCIRARWYVMNDAWREEGYENGITAIVYNFKFDSPERYKRTARAREGIPYRISAFHICCTTKTFATRIRMFLAKYARVRYREHFGDPEEIKFALQTYGIPPMGGFPLQDDGSISLEWLYSWLQVRRRQEEMEASAQTVSITPRRFDVLFGRGKNTRCHTGNLRALHLVESHREEYEAATKFEKTAVAERIVQMIKESQGRFLKWEGESGWVEVDGDLARDKISHLFRNVRSRKTNASQNKEKDQLEQEKRKQLSSALPESAVSKARCRGIKNGNDSVSRHAQ